MLKIQHSTLHSIIPLSQINYYIGQKHYPIVSHIAILWSDLQLREVINKVLHGEAPPWGPTSYPFIYHFRWKVKVRDTQRQFSENICWEDDLILNFRKDKFWSL